MYQGWPFVPCDGHLLRVTGEIFDACGQFTCSPAVLIYCCTVLAPRPTSTNIHARPELYAMGIENWQRLRDYHLSVLVLAHHFVR